MKNTKLQAIGQRNASEPYTIILDAPYILTNDALTRQVDERLKRKREWFYPNLKIISEKGTSLKLRLTCRKIFHEMTVNIESDKLHIACSCKQSVETLCLHTYKALDRLVGFRSTTFFKNYGPNGLMEIATRHRKYFVRKLTDSGISFKPKASLGNIYQLADNMDGAAFEKILQLPQASQHQQPRDTIITYIMVCPYHNKQLTFLLPCLGLLNKPHDDIKNFDHFISGTEKNYDSFLTDDQRTLNRLCYEMWQLVETQIIPPVERLPEPEYAQGDIFNLWEKALPLLVKQEFIYSFCLYNKRQLKEKPQKARVERITLMKDRPRLHFQLLDKGSFYQLHMKVALRDKNIHRPNTDTTFFIEEDKRFYLLASLRDTGIVKWMHTADDHITIFREHFSDFEQQYLDQLRQCYAVTTVSSISSKAETSFYKPQTKVL